MGDNGKSSGVWSRFARSTYWSRPVQSEQTEEFQVSTPGPSIVRPRITAEDRLVKISYLIDLLTMRYYKDIQNAKKKTVEDLHNILDDELIRKTVETFWNNLNKNGNEKLAMEVAVNELFVSIAKKL